MTSKNMFDKITFSTYGRTIVDSNWSIVERYGMNRLYYIHDGTAYFHDDRGVHVLKKDHLYFFPPNIKFDLYCKQGSLNHSFVDFIILPILSSKYFIEINPKSKPYLDVSTNALITMIQSFPMYPPTTPAKYQDIIKNYLVSLLTLLIDETNLNVLTDKRLNDALLHIHRNFHNDISVDELAKIACMEKNYFIRFFKNHMSTTPYQYIKLYRLNISYMLLQQNHSVSEIASMLNYSDASAFSNTFKKTFGYWPTELKEKIKINNQPMKETEK